MRAELAPAYNVPISDKDITYELIDHNYYPNVTAAANSVRTHLPCNLSYSPYDRMQLHADLTWICKLAASSTHCGVKRAGCNVSDVRSPMLLNVDSARWIPHTHRAPELDGAPNASNALTSCS